MKTAEEVLSKHEWLPGAGWTKSSIILAMEEYRSQPHLPAINALSQKMYGCDYSEVHLPERRAELLEKYLGIEREA